MEIEALVQIVSQTGFPIAVCIFLLWKGYTQDQEYLKLMTTMSEQLKSISEKLK